MAENQRCDEESTKSSDEESDYDDDDEEEEEEEEEEDERVSEVQGVRESRVSEFQGCVEPCVEGELREAQSETLIVPPLSSVGESDQVAGLQVNSTWRLVEGMEFKEVNGKADQNQKQNQDQPHSSVCPSSSLELSPTSVTQSISSAPSPTLLEQRPSLKKVNSVCLLKVNQHKNSSKLKTSVPRPRVKTSASDGFNWRKYGQKLVKSPKGSRSYYKCTFTECCAKRIDCCDHSSGVIDMVYKGQHNHDPPRKNSCIKESQLASSAGPVIENTATEHPIKLLNDTNRSTSLKEPVQETAPAPDRKRQKTSDSNWNGELKVKDESFNEPERKRRVKKDDFVYSGSLVKPGKKPKLVVHAVKDAGISGDGYRWRKYGQKMVKGNPHPRNYYKCTSAGCSVRKHIETAADNTSAVIITYKGVHDHDMPVPKRRHGPPSAPLVAATAPASMNNSQLKHKTFQDHISSTQWSVDTEGELTGAVVDLGGEKAMESARTLLSIGFEIKPC